jgi:hypothetical protein
LRRIGPPQRGSLAGRVDRGPRHVLVRGMLRRIGPPQRGSLDGRVDSGPRHVLVRGMLRRIGPPQRGSLDGRVDSGPRHVLVRGMLRRIGPPQRGSLNGSTRERTGRTAQMEGPAQSALDERQVTGRTVLRGPKPLGGNTVWVRIPPRAHKPARSEARGSRRSTRPPRRRGSCTVPTGPTAPRGGGWCSSTAVGEVISRTSNHGQS